MEYRVEELASACGVGVDTLRFYQSRGLLPPPRRAGRVALYGEAHRERLARIRALARDGLPLALVKRVLDREEATPAEAGAKAPGEAGAPSLAPLLSALAEEKVGARTFTRRQLAEEAGVPEALLAAAQSAGLIEPMRSGGEERFAEADLAMVRAGLAILDAGFPIDELLELAMRHAHSTQEIVESAVELFDRHVRRAEGRDAEATAAAFRELLPQVTRLVALYFQRALVGRALERLRGRGDAEALSAAIAAVESGRLEVAWRS